LAQDPAQPEVAPELVVLSHEAFIGAVRQALRDLHRPDELVRNPLTRGRVVADRCTGSDRPDVVLKSVLMNACATLDDDPREHKRWKALDHTYLRPAPSQEKAAEVLGLPFSTYRRHLTEGVDRVVAHLWDLEIHGTGGREG
jgi:hypothetical protein